MSRTSSDNFLRFCFAMVLLLCQSQAMGGVRYNCSGSLHHDLKVDGIVYSSADVAQQRTFEHVHILLLCGASFLITICLLYGSRRRRERESSTVLQVSEQMPHSQEFK